MQFIRGSFAARSRNYRREAFRQAKNEPFGDRPESSTVRHFPRVRKRAGQAPQRRFANRERAENAAFGLFRFACRWRQRIGES